jgi:hypothetical protein
MELFAIGEIFYKDFAPGRATELNFQADDIFSLCESWRDNWRTQPPSHSSWLMKENFYRRLVSNGERGRNLFQDLHLCACASLR